MANMWFNGVTLIPVQYSVLDPNTVIAVRYGYKLGNIAKKLAKEGTSLIDSKDVIAFWFKIV